MATSNSPGRFFLFFLFPIHLVYTKLKNHFEQRMQSKQWRRGNSETREKQGRFKKEGYIQHISCPVNLLLLFRISTQKIPFPSGKNEEMLLTIIYYVLYICDAIILFCFVCGLNCAQSFQKEERLERTRTTRSP